MASPNPDSMLPEGEIPPGDSDPSRTVACPNCGGELSVAAFNPLEEVECLHCQTRFELLKQFGDFELVRACENGDLGVVYLANNRVTGERAIIKVLAAQALSQADAVEKFLREAGESGNKCQDDQVSDRVVDQLNGFVYLRLTLKEGVLEENVLQSLNVTVEPQAVFPVEGPVGTTVPSREAGAQATKVEEPARIVSANPPPLPAKRTSPCPYCKMLTDVTEKDPLDQYICESCGQSFDLLRHFGHYCIESRLGVGGTSVLYLARDAISQGAVALKVLSVREMMTNPSAIPTFKREIETMKNLKHPNIVRVYEGGELQGFYFMAMEFLDGLTLNQILDVVQGGKEAGKKDAPKASAPSEESARFKRALPELFCLEVVLQAAAGLGAVHDQGLVHGDVKPGNIMVTYDGEVKVLDFGLVQFANTETLLTEGEGFSVFGTPLYIPPERVRGELEDFRSDIYSLGATLYHLVRGIPPFRAKTPTELIMMHAEQLPVGFKVCMPTASDTTCRIIDKSLKKIVDDRYSSHIEFIADLMLAKNLVMQTMEKKPKDEKTILQDFMNTMPTTRKKLDEWKYAANSVLERIRKSGDTVRTVIPEKPSRS